MVRVTVVGERFSRRPASAKLACSATLTKVRSVRSLSIVASPLEAIIVKNRNYEVRTYWIIAAFAMNQKRPPAY